MSDTSRHTVTWVLAAAADHVTEHFEQRLQLEVSAKKSVAVSGRPGIAAAVAVLTRRRKVTAQRESKLLGVAPAGGRRRSVAVLKGRLKQLVQRTPRIQALRRAGLSAARLTRAAGTPVATYGADVTG